MATATLAEWLALNDQLVALVGAGVPIDLGLPPNRRGAAAALERIGAAVTRRIGEGATLSEALEDRTVPSAYRSLAQLALTSGDLPAALAGPSRTAAALDDCWHALWLSLLYPLVVCCLAYGGFVLFCTLLVPRLDSMYQNMRISAGIGLAAVDALRSTLPYWIALPPLALLLLVGWARFAAPHAGAWQAPARMLAWLPGMGRVIFEHRAATFAESLASLLDLGLRLPEGLRQTAGLWEDDTFEQGFRALAASLERVQALTEDSSFAAQLPPFLRWAIWHADGPVGRARALRMAADAYRQSAQRRVDRLRILAPMIACVVIGGGITLLYGLALFVPVAQMLRGLAH